MTNRAEDQIIHYLKDKVGLAEADRLLAAFKDEVLREFGADAPQKLRRRADDIIDGQTPWDTDGPHRSGSPRKPCSRRKSGISFRRP